MFSSKTEIRKMEKQISMLSIKKRLEILEDLSRTRFDFFGPNVIPKSGPQHKYQTYELGLIALFSLIIDKYNNRYSSSESWIHNTCKIIREQLYLNEIFDSNRWNGIAAIALMQAYLKQYIMLLYRSNYLYTYTSKKLNLNKKFKEIYNTDYSEFLTLFSIVLVYSKINNKEKLLELLKKHTPTAFRTLCINYEDFKDLYEPFHKWRDIQFVNFNFLHRYPFIDYQDSIFLPYWPALTYAITESLMFDITRDNGNKKGSDFRTKIGKYAFEDYVYHITKVTKANENCVVSKEIIYNKQQKRTSDVIVAYESDLLLVEVKFMNYRLAIRNFDLETIKYTEDRLADCLVQVYKNIVAIKFKEISHKLLSNTDGDIIGVIVVLDDYYLNVESIYQKALNIINSFDKSLTLDNLKQSICFTSLYVYERICYYSNTNIIAFYKDILKVKKQYNYWEYITEYNSQKGGINMKNVNSFYKKILEDAANIIKEHENVAGE